MTIIKAVVRDLTHCDEDNPHLTPEEILKIGQKHPHALYKCVNPDEEPDALIEVIYSGKFNIKKLYEHIGWDYDTANSE